MSAAEPASPKRPLYRLSLSLSGESARNELELLFSAPKGLCVMFFKQAARLRKLEEMSFASSLLFLLFFFFFFFFNVREKERSFALRYILRARNYFPA